MSNTAGVLTSTQEFFSWFEGRKKAHHFEVNEIPFSQLRNWTFDPQSKDLVHSSGKFFTIHGLRVSSQLHGTQAWDQPIINQPEIGILGIVTKVFGGIRYFLMQAKMEPGNVNLLQLSPTVQATRSNFTLVHGGNTPAYLEYFFDHSKGRRIADQLQSEQGSRFLKKRNRNIIVDVTEAIALREDFCWLTLKHLKQIARVPNILNMDSRSVLALVPSERPADPESSYQSTTEVLSWLTELKSQNILIAEYLPLGLLKSWKWTDTEIHHESNKYFSVMAVSVTAGNREILNWTQPILKSSAAGITGLLIQKQNGVPHFLVQARAEAGTFDGFEIGPTLSHAQGAHSIDEPENVPFLDIFQNSAAHHVHYSAMQSAEGGRFYHDQNKIMIIEVAADTKIALPLRYTWLTLRQIQELIQYNNLIDIEVRELLACLDFSAL